jgi:hypothetical protein
LEKSEPRANDETTEEEGGTLPKDMGYRAPLAVNFRLGHS